MFSPGSSAAGSAPLWQCRTFFRCPSNRAPARHLPRRQPADGLDQAGGGEFRSTGLFLSPAGRGQGVGAAAQAAPSQSASLIFSQLFPPTQSFLRRSAPPPHHPEGHFSPRGEEAAPLLPPALPAPPRRFAPTLPARAEGWALAPVVLPPAFPLRPCRARGIIIVCP